MARWPLHWAIPAMNLLRILWVIPIALLTIPASRLAAEEMVTIPKSRLEELERKEAELDRLKGDLSKAKAEKTQLQKHYDETVAKAATAQLAPTVSAQPSPPVASLPPLQSGEIVDALDLANHYRADPAAADRRYRKRTVQVRGEIARFEKPMFTRDYKIVLQSSDRQVSVLCDFSPPDNYQSVYTTQGGSQLVATLVGQKRLVLARVGDTVTIQGQCRGLSDSSVKLADCAIRPGR
jgi:putative nucleic acid binding protein